MKKFSETTLGMWLITITPAILAYLTATKDLTNLINKINMEQYKPLIIALVVWLISYLIYSSIQKRRKKQAELESELSELKQSINSGVGNLKPSMTGNISDLKASIFDAKEKMNDLAYDTQLRIKMLSSIIDYNTQVNRIETVPNRIVGQQFSVEDLKHLGFNDNEIRKVFPDYHS